MAAMMVQQPRLPSSPVHRLSLPPAIWCVIMILAIMMMVTSCVAQNYTIGIVLAYQSGRTSDVINERYVANCRQALLDVYSGTFPLKPPLPPGVNINLEFATSYGLVSGSLVAAQTVINRHAIGMIGPFYSEEALAVATLASATSVPLLSPSASLSDLSDKVRYPFEIRGRTVDIAVGIPLLSLFKQMSWRRICVMASNEVYGRSLASWLDGQAAKSTDGSLEVHSAYFTASSDPNVTGDSATGQWMGLLANFDCRVFVVHCATSYAGPAIHAADQLGLLDNPKYAIVGTMDWVPNAKLFLQQNRMRGIFGIIAATPTVDMYQQWLPRIPVLWSDDSLYQWSTTPPALSEATWYDCVPLFAQAIANLHANRTVVNGSTLLVAMQSLNNIFTGASGAWQWDTNYDRYGLFDLVQFQINNQSSTTRLGLYDNTTQTFDMTKYGSVPLIFAGGATKVARDGVSTLYGDTLTPTANGSILTLAFVIGLTSTWSALILVEQVIYAAEKQQQWWLWALACAITQGGPGVWALHMIGMCAMSWPTPAEVGHLRFNPSWSLGSMFLTIAINLMAFYAALYGWQTNKAWVDKGSSHRAHALQYQQQVSTSPKTVKTRRQQVVPAHGHHHPTAPSSRHRGSVGNGRDRSSPHHHNPSRHQYSGGSGSESSDDDSSSVTSGTRRRRRVIKLAADRTVMGQLLALPYRFNLWFALSACLLSATTIISHWMIANGLPSSYGTHVSSGPLVITFFVGNVAFTFAILMFFYFFPIATSVRLFAALLLHSFNFISHVVANLGYSYSYATNTDGLRSNWWSADDIILAVSIATAAMCFLLLAINVDRMKLSRNALDLIVVRFKKELASTVAQVAAEREHVLQLKREKDRLWHMLEAINLCRPFQRDHALATTFAEYEAEAAPFSPLSQQQKDKDKDKDKDRDGMHSHRDRDHNVNGSVNGSVSSHIPTTTDKLMDDLVTDPLLSKPPKARAASALSIYQQLCSTIQLNSPTPDAVAREMKLEHILKHPVTLELFKDAMLKDALAEPLMLYLDIRRYKATTDPQLRAVLSREIHDTFLVTGAIYGQGCEMSSSVRKSLEAKLAVLASLSDDYRSAPVDLFHAVEQELMARLQSDMFPRFVGTPQYNLCAMIFGRPQFRLKTLTPFVPPSPNGMNGGQSPPHAPPVRDPTPPGAQRIRPDGPTPALPDASADGQSSGQQTGGGGTGNGKDNDASSHYVMDDGSVDDGDMESKKKAMAEHSLVSGSGHSGNGAIAAALAKAARQNGGILPPIPMIVSGGHHQHIGAPPIVTTTIPSSAVGMGGVGAITAAAMSRYRTSHHSSNATAAAVNVNAAMGFDHIRVHHDNNHHSGIGIGQNGVNGANGNSGNSGNSGGNSIMDSHYHLNVHTVGGDVNSLIVTDDREFSAGAAGAAPIGMSASNSPNPDSYNHHRHGGGGGANGQFASPTSNLREIHGNGNGGYLSASPLTQTRTAQGILLSHLSSPTVTVRDLGSPPAVMDGATSALTSPVHPIMTSIPQAPPTHHTHALSSSTFSTVGLAPHIPLSSQSSPPAAYRTTSTVYDRHTYQRTTTTTTASGHGNIPTSVSQSYPTTSYSHASAQQVTTTIISNNALLPPPSSSTTASSAPVPSSSLSSSTPSTPVTPAGLVPTVMNTPLTPMMESTSIGGGSSSDSHDTMDLSATPITLTGATTALHGRNGSLPGVILTPTSHIVEPSPTSSP